MRSACRRSRGCWRRACKRAPGAGGVDGAGAARVRRAPRRFSGRGSTSWSPSEPTAGAALQAELRRAADAALAAFARHERYLADELSAGADRGAGLRRRGAGSAAARGALSRPQTADEILAYALARRWTRPRPTWRRTRADFGAADWREALARAGGDPSHGGGLSRPLRGAVGEQPRAGREARTC